MRKAVFAASFLAFALLWVPGVYPQAPFQNQGNAASSQRQSLFHSMRASGNRTLRNAAPQQTQPAPPSPATATPPQTQPSTPAPATATPPQTQPQSQPEVPKKESVIEVKDDKLSVDVSNADLGAVMTQIGAKMHIPVQVSGTVYSRKISTKFTGLDIDRGIQRLLALAGERNYLIRYNETGALGGIELYAENPSPTTGPHASGMASPTTRFSPNPLFRRRYRRFTPPQPRQPGQQQGQPTVEQVGQ